MSKKVDKILENMDQAQREKFTQVLIKEMLDTAYPVSAAAGVLRKFTDGCQEDENLANVAVAIFSIAYNILCTNQEIIAKSDELKGLDIQKLYSALYIACGVSVYDHEIDIIGYIDEACRD